MGLQQNLCNLLGLKSFFCSNLRFSGELPGSQSKKEDIASIYKTYDEKGRSTLTTQGSKLFPRREFQKKFSRELCLEGIL